MNYSYTLKFSSRKSISIKILSDNSIVISCPKGMSNKKIEHFLSSKRVWIENHLQRNEQINEGFRDVINGKALLVKGKAVRFCISEKDFFCEDEINLTSLGKLKSVYVKNLGGEFEELLNEISLRTRLKYSKVSFRAYKSRWGCCSKNREIIFNYKILMLPKDIWSYVIVHELCHTVHMNHSAAFWNCVAAYLPTYKTAKKKIKQYSFLCSMYC